MPQWTEDQKKAIWSSAKTIICSAAAGSGKTAVMIERIVRLIRDGADPFSFLVIRAPGSIVRVRKSQQKRMDSEAILSEVLFQFFP